MTPREQAGDRRLQIVTPEGLKEFGNHVREARVRKGWTLETLAREALSNPDRKGYVSQVENGKRPLSALTIGNLARVLDLPPEVTRPLLFAPADQDEVTREDRLAETLIRRNEADPAPPQAEALVIALAYEFAGGQFLDLSTAYTGLRAALQAAAEMRAELERLHNLDDRLAAVLRRVADLNDQGLRDEAGAALEAAIKAKEAELEGLHEAALKQDRLRNDPAAAANRLIARLRASAPPGGVFLATQRLLIDSHENGKQRGDPYYLALALELAEANRNSALGPQLGKAFNNLGVCHFTIGERQSNVDHLTRALDAFAEALKLTSRESDSLGWAGIQTNLGNALRLMGERTDGPDLLRQAEQAHRAALSVYTREETQRLWAASQSNLGAVLQRLGTLTGDPEQLRKAVEAQRDALTFQKPEEASIVLVSLKNNLCVALRWRGTVTGDTEVLDEAAHVYDECLCQLSRDDGAFLWATIQWNLADLALARHALSPDPANLATARHHLAQAREVFAEEGNDHQLAECDRLQALIDAA